MNDHNADRIATTLDRIADLLALLVDRGTVLPQPTATDMDALRAELDEANDRAERARAEIERADAASRIERDRLLAEAKARTKAGIKPLPQATDLARGGRPKETA